jgi:hypothetical protein
VISAQSTRFGHLARAKQLLCSLSRRARTEKKRELSLFFSNGGSEYFERASSHEWLAAAVIDRAMVSLGEGRTGSGHRHLDRDFAKSCRPRKFEGEEPSTADD